MRRTRRPCHSGLGPGWSSRQCTPRRLLAQEGGAGDQPADGHDVGQLQALAVGGRGGAEGDGRRVQGGQHPVQALGGAQRAGAGGHRGAQRVALERHAAGGAQRRVHGVAGLVRRQVGQHRARGAVGEHAGLRQGVAGHAVGAVHPRARHLAGGPEPRDRAARREVRGDAADHVVLAGLDGHDVAAEVEAVAAHAGQHGGELLGQLLGGDPRRVQPRTAAVEDPLGHDVPRRELGVGVAVEHEAPAVAVQEVRARPPQRLGQQEPPRRPARAPSARSGGTARTPGRRAPRRPPRPARRRPPWPRRGSSSPRRARRTRRWPAAPPARAAAGDPRPAGPTARRPPARRRPATHTPVARDAGGAPSARLTARALEALEAPGRQPLPPAPRAVPARSRRRWRPRCARSARRSARPRAPAPARPSRSRSNTAPRRSRSVTRAATSNAIAATARASPSPSPARSVSAACSSGESSRPTGAAIPPCASGVDPDPPALPLSTTATRDVRVGVQHVERGDQPRDTRPDDHDVEGTLRPRPRAHLLGRHRSVTLMGTRTFPSRTVWSRRSRGRLRDWRDTRPPSPTPPEAAVNPAQRMRVVWLVLLGLAAVWLLSGQTGVLSGQEQLTYTEFEQAVQQGEVEEVLFTGPSITGQYTDGTAFTSYLPAARGDRCRRHRVHAATRTGSRSARAPTTVASSACCCRCSSRCCSSSGSSG